jgi:hypothetical protein
MEATNQAEEEQKYEFEELPGVTSIYGAYIGIDPASVTITAGVAVKGLKWIWRGWRATSLVSSAVQHYQSLGAPQGTSVTMSRDHALHTYTIDTLQVMLGAEYFWATRTQVQQAHIAHVINTAISSGGAVTLSEADLERIGIHELNAIIEQRPNFMTLDTQNLPSRVIGSDGFIELLVSQGFLEAAAFTINNYAANNQMRYTHLMIISYRSEFIPALGTTLSPKPSLALVRSQYFECRRTFDLKSPSEIIGEQVWIGGPQTVWDIGYVVGPVRRLHYRGAFVDNHQLYFEPPFTAGFKYPFAGYTSWDLAQLIPGAGSMHLHDQLLFAIESVNYYTLSNIRHIGMGLITPFPIEIGIPSTNMRTSVFIPDITADFTEGNISLFDQTQAHIWERSIPYTGASSITWEGVLDPPYDMPGDATYRQWLESLEARLAIAMSGLGLANMAIDGILERLDRQEAGVGNLEREFERLQERQEQQAIEQERAIDRGIDRVIEGQRAQELLEGILNTLNNLGQIIIGDFSTINFDAFMNADGLTSRFPFSLPWDFQYVLESLSAPAEAPRFYFDWRGTAYSEVGVVVVDLSEFQIIASTVRFILSLLFTISLIFVSIKIIK